MRAVGCWPVLAPLCCLLRGSVLSAAGLCAVQLCASFAHAHCWCLGSSQFQAVRAFTILGFLAGAFTVALYVFIVCSSVRRGEKPVIMAAVWNLITAFLILIAMVSRPAPVASRGVCAASCCCSSWWRAVSGSTWLAGWPHDSVRRRRVGVARASGSRRPRTDPTTRAVPASGEPLLSSSPLRFCAALFLGVFRLIAFTWPLLLGAMALAFVSRKS